jgi:cytochrome c oxidase subunit 2
MKLDVTKLPLGEVLTGFVLAAVVATFVLAYAFASGSGIEDGEADEEAATEPSARGQEIALSFGCTACHSTTGEVIIGPSWLNLFGRMETLGDGTEVLVDEAYIEESILDPSAKVVQGFDAVMPAFLTLTAEDIQDIIAFMQTLSEEAAAATPAAEETSEETASP